MNLSATILLAFGMSMDAFAASIGKGATLHKPKFSEAVRTGLIFGAIETLTPLVGWGLGMLASQFILEWNHWIAFILLVFLGGRMIVEGFRGDSDEACEAPHDMVSGFWSPPPSPPALTRWPSRRSGLPAGQHCDHRAGDRLRHLYHVDAGDDGRSLYRPAAWQTSRNSRRYRADWHRQRNPLEPFRRLSFTLRAASSGS